MIAYNDQRLTKDQAERYRSFVDRAARGEPIPYLIGRASFCGRDFYVNPAVLIPRPETELLVEAALSWVRKSATDPDALRVVDIGTGSGCIAITLALALPGAIIEANDISEAALGVARLNAETHGVGERVHFRHGPLLEIIKGEPDLILANLPYIADHEWTTLDDGVKWYEPDIALRGGADGLELIEQLLNQAARRLAPGGAVFLEIGWRQGPAVQRLAQSAFPPAEVSVLQDLAGHDRIVKIVHASKSIGR